MGAKVIVVGLGGQRSFAAPGMNWHSADKAAIPKLADLILKAVGEQRLDNRSLQNNYFPEP